MTISFQIPPYIEQELSHSGADLGGQARRAFLLDLCRQHRISHARLCEALGVSFHEAEGLIKEYRAGHDFPIEEFEEQLAFLRGSLEG
jgi:hypothetical protein